MSVSSAAASGLQPTGECSAPEVAANIRELVEREYAVVWRFLRRLGVPQAQVDDAAQAVFARVLANDARIRPGSERAYLMKAAFRASFEYARARRRAAERSAELEVEELCSAEPAPDELLSRRRERAVLDAALDRLPQDLRAAFTLYELEGLTFSEIADVLDIPRGTVASRLRRARELFTRAVRTLKAGGT